MFKETNGEHTKQYLPFYCLPKEKGAWKVHAKGQDIYIYNKGKGDGSCKYKKQAP